MPFEQVMVNDRMIFLKAQKLHPIFFLGKYDPKCLVCKQSLRVNDYVFFVYSNELHNNSHALHQICYTGIETVQEIFSEWENVKEYSYWFE